MKLSIDTSRRVMMIEEENGKSHTIDLYSKEAFEHLSRAWLKTGWNLKYTYTFSWMGRPVIQLPEDMLRVQEVLYRVKPDMIIETGIAHGGSLIYYASLCKAAGKGRVIGVDIEIRAHNRKAIEAHELFPLITLIEGSSVDVDIVEEVKTHVKPRESVLVLLDSNHTKQHVLAELEAYAPFVTKNSYIVATDGIMQDLYDVPRGKKEWAQDNPVSAVREFAARHSEFIVEQPPWPFNESGLSQNATHWPSAYLKRIK